MKFEIFIFSKKATSIKPIENFLNVDTDLLKMNFKFRFIVYLKPSFCLGSPHGVEIHKDKAGGVDCGGFEPTQWQQDIVFCLVVVIRSFISLRPN